MRYYHKKLVLSSLETLKEALTEGRTLLQRKKYAELSSLLSECQASAIRIGEFIEAHQENPVSTVALLENFCERIYQLYISVEAVRKKEFQQLQRLYSQVLAAAKKELTADKIEIAFFPYKASMFDTFDSIFRAAQSDPRCEAYVVPVPYFDRRADGSLGEMHCDVRQYPDDIPISDWRSYRLEDRHPEIIFIHNFYDGSNKVTSIHPNYYSSRLKQYTDRLVLIPYAVSSKDEVAELFAFQPGFFEADRVIVQSETIRQGYIRHFRRYEQTYRVSLGDLEKKFAALGSPKFDRIIRLQQTPPPVPAEWRKILRPGRVAVLYNTSLHAILEKSDTYLSKLRSALAAFRSRSGLALIWRPHPLTEATLRAMRPNLLEEYQEIVRTYQREGWGILDSSGDMSRAVVLADAYYGDWSSLMPLFQCLGKPVMVQYCGVPDQPASLDSMAQQMQIPSFTIGKDAVYFYDAATDGIFRLDLQSHEFRLETLLPADAASQAFSGYMQLDGTKDALFPAPAKGRAPFSYDLREKVLKHGPIRRQTAGTRRCCIWKDRVFYVPLKGDDLVWLDRSSNAVRYVPNWLGAFSAGADTQVCGLPFAADGRLWIPCGKPDGLAEFDCASLTLRAFHPLHDVRTAALEGGRCWWANGKGELSCLDLSSKQDRKIGSFTSWRQPPPGELNVYFLACAGGRLTALPHQYHPESGCRAYQIDTKTLQIKELPELSVPAAPEANSNQRLRCYCGAEVTADGVTAAYCNARNTLVFLEPETSEVRQAPLEMDLRQVCADMQSYIYENQLLTLEDFLDALLPPKGAAGWKDSKKRTLFIHRSIMQIVHRDRRHGGEADTGVRKQDGGCGQRIITSLLREFGLKGETE